jgi:hypothetical protein
LRWKDRYTFAEDNKVAFSPDEPVRPISLLSPSSSSLVVQNKNASRNDNISGDMASDPHLHTKETRQSSPSMGDGDEHGLAEEQTSLYLEIAGEQEYRQFPSACTSPMPGWW